MRFFYDTEFIDNGILIVPISIGMVADDGREFYAEFADVPWRMANDWVLANVKPLLGPEEERKPREQIAAELLAFVSTSPGTPEFWAWYGAYDHVMLMQLYGPMMEKPEGWPMMTMDIRQLQVGVGMSDTDLNIAVPQDAASKHNALDDARWNRRAHQYIHAVLEGVVP